MLLPQHVLQAADSVPIPLWIRWAETLREAPHRPISGSDVFAEIEQFKNPGKADPILQYHGRPGPRYAKTHKYGHKWILPAMQTKHQIHGKFPGSRPEKRGWFRFKLGQQLKAKQLLFPIRKRRAFRPPAQLKRLKWQGRGPHGPKHNHHEPDARRLFSVLVHFIWKWE